MQIGGQDTTFGGRNRIINGAMVIDQRNAGASQTWNNSNGYTLDRYFAYASNGGGAFSTQQVTDAPSGFTNSLKITVTTADSSLATSDIYFLQQKIEGYNVADLGWGSAGAQAITVSFWTKSSITGSFPLTIIDSAGGANYRSYGVLYTINQANTWEYKTMTIPGETAGNAWNKTNGTGMQVSFGLGGGSQYIASPNVWTTNKEAYNLTGNTNLISTNNATLQITGLQVEKGSSATAFEHRQYGTELSLCQRYYENSYPVGSAVGSTQTSSPQGGTFMWRTRSDGWYESMNSGSTQFKIPKRTSPGLRYWDYAGNLSKVGVLYGSSNQAITAGSPVSGSSTNGFYADVNTVVSSVVFIYWEANAEL
jgi:hypothetical protein